MCSPEPYMNELASRSSKSSRSSMTSPSGKPGLNTSSLPLSSGGKIPVFGLGTFGLKGDQGAEAVKTAISTGYRLIDAAYIYGNEKIVGKGINEAIKTGVVKREDLFVESKVFNSYHSQDKLKECFNKDLKDLGLDYLDLYLIHWPQAYKDATGGEDVLKNKNGKIQYSQVDYLETWEAMEELVKQGKTKAIGLSNFSIKQITRVLEYSKIKPAALQVECHPFLTQEPLVNFCKQNSIQMIGYSPLGSPGSPDAPDKKDKPVVLKDPTLKKIGDKYGKTAAQVALRFQLQRGVIPIPKSGNPDHIKENADIFNFELNEEDMAAVLKLNRNFRYIASDDDRDHPRHPFFGAEKD